MAFGIGGSSTLCRAARCRARAPGPVSKVPVAREPASADCLRKLLRLQERSCHNRAEQSEADAGHIVLGATDDYEPTLVDAAGGCLARPRGRRAAPHGLQPALPGAVAGPDLAGVIVTIVNIVLTTNAAAPVSC